MNNKGQAIFVGFMVMLALIVLALGLSPGVKQSVDIARNTTNMDCNNASISDFDKVGCIAVDMTNFYFTAGLLVLAIGIFASRKFK